MHADAETPFADLACPDCHLPLDRHGDQAVCGTCRGRFPRRDGIWDFEPEHAPIPRGLGPALMHFPPVARIYERLWRPAFILAATRAWPDDAREFAIIERMLGEAAGGSVVDLSCGPGLWARRLVRSGRYDRVYALDRSWPMLAECRALCRMEGLSALTLVHGDALRLPFGDRLLAGAHAGAAIHLWPTPEVAMREVARILRPGGVFAASTFVRSRRGSLPRLAERAFERGGRVRLFEEGEIEALTSQAGFESFEEIRRGMMVFFAARRPAGT